MTSKSMLIFSITIFTSVILVLLGFLGGYIENIDNEQETRSSSIIGIEFNIIKGINLLPLWFNGIIFGSISVTLLWVILSSLPTINGGS